MAGCLAKQAKVTGGVWGRDYRYIPFSMSAWEQVSCLFGSTHRLHVTGTNPNIKPWFEAQRHWLDVFWLFQFLLFPFVFIPMFCSLHLPPTSNCRVRVEKFVCKLISITGHLSLKFFVKSECCRFKLWWYFLFAMLFAQAPTLLQVVYLNHTSWKCREWFMGFIFICS